jgi:NAD-dependent SIR2 family protein deacetylase
MLTMKCTKCHHEWQQYQPEEDAGGPACAWCGAPGERLYNDDDLERWRRLGAEVGKITAQSIQKAIDRLKKERG